MMAEAQNLKEVLGPVAVAVIPIDAIVEARHALAGEYITLKVELEKTSIITLLHRKRIVTRVGELMEYLSRLDAWLEGVQK